LQRYIIAYDGDVTEDKSKASHVICNKLDPVVEQIQKNKKIKVVTSMWAWNSINTCSLQPEKTYRVIGEKEE